MTATSPLRRALRLLLLAGALALPAEARAQAVQVVVNAENPVESLTRQQVADLFLRKTRSWPGGLVALPVDHRRGAPLRERFSVALLGRGAREVEAYWQKLVFTGRAVPPVEKSGDRAVLAFVRAHPGAIGYVAAGTPLGPGLRAVAVH